MKVILFDNANRNKLFPLTFTRAVADIRMGIFSIKKRWEKLLNLEVLVFTENYLQPLYSEILPGEYYLIDASLISFELVEKVESLEIGQALYHKNEMICSRVNLETNHSLSNSFTSLVKNRIEIENASFIEYPHQLFQLNEEFLKFDFSLLSPAPKGIDFYLKSNTLLNSSSIYIDEGASVNYSLLNAETGPIHIGKDATVMEGCLIRGPFSLGEGATLKMGTKVYGATTLGPGCVAGGELKNVVMFGFSNKAHDGYLGDSVIGEWCNFGAGTSNSNVKNTASDVKIWDYSTRSYISGGVKCGLIMGDYSKTAINTSINTGTVIGVCCNIFGQGLTRKLFPNFTWSSKELSKYELEKAITDITNWKNFKGKKFLSSEVEVLRYIFDNFND